MLKKWEEEKLGFEEITVNNLVCKDCVHKFNKPVGVCEKFKRKPNSVLGGGSCSEYEKDERE